MKHTKLYGTDLRRKEALEDFRSASATGCDRASTAPTTTYRTRCATSVGRSSPDFSVQALT